MANAAENFCLGVGNIDQSSMCKGLGTIPSNETKQRQNLCVYIRAIFLTKLCIRNNNTLLSNSRLLYKMELGSHFPTLIPIVTGTQTFKNKGECSKKIIFCQNYF